jgi:phosphoribosylanthranilate isomerase
MFPDQKRAAVKICGITQAQQARDIISLGADALGINFWPKSKRYLPVDIAAAWLPALLDQITLIAVLVNPDADTLNAIIDQHLVHILQLHGDETPAEVADLMDRGYRVIKALQVRDRESLFQIGCFPCETILLDAFNPGLYGGSGETFPWDLAVIAQDMFPEKRIILSGGLTPANVRQAIESTHPAAVDVASGVESSPGIKDLILVREFIEQSRLAA